VIYVTKNVNSIIKIRFKIPRPEAAKGRATTPEPIVVPEIKNIECNNLITMTLRKRENVIYIC
jgi:hypothetical protein